MANMAYIFKESIKFLMTHGKLEIDFRQFH